MRTAICPKCGARHLKWAQNALGMRYLVEFDSGREHYLTCPGVQTTERSEPIELPELTPSETVQNAPSSKTTEPETSDESDSTESETESDQHSDTNPDRDTPSSSDGESETDSTESDESDQDGDGDQDEDEPESEPEPEPEIQPVPETAPSAPEHEHKLQRQLDALVKIRPALNIMLVGPAGSGKTTACRIAAERAGLVYTERSMGPATSQWDLLGFQSPTTGAYVPGILRAPYELGGVLALDEVDNSNPSVPTAWNSALANGHFTFPDNIEVARHPDFVCVACANTYGRGADRLYVGRQQLDAATLDRFVVIDWEYDERAEVDWAGADAIAREWVPFVQGLRRRAFELRERVVISPRASIYGARMLRAGVDRRMVEESTIFKGMAPDVRAKLAGR